MSSFLKAMAQVLADVAKTEDDTLRRLCNQGIFFMPEIAYAYTCGKELISRKATLAPDFDVAWKRELKLHTDGPSDLVIDLPDGRQVAVEFKMGSRSDAYGRDIEKLMRLPEPKTARVFCALVDSFSRKLPDKDERIQKIESKFPGALTRLLEPFPSFRTLQSRHKGEISCVVAVWAVWPLPEWTQVA